MGREDWLFEQISKTTQPCQICGKSDFCYRRQHRVDGNVEHCCHRVSSQTDVIGQDGRIYLWKKEITPTTGVVEVFETEEDRALWRGNGANSSKIRKPQNPILQYVPVSGPIEGEVAVSASSERNKFNLELSKVMRLDAKHEASLKKDWNTNLHPDLFEKVVSKYPILSCPPSDYTYSRYGYEGSKQCPSRTKTAQSMAQAGWDITKFPGFVINQKGEKTIVSAEGIWFPIYDKDGNLISWRVRCDYPDVKGTFNGREGIFSHGYDKNGKETVSFYDAETHKPELVNIKWAEVKGKVQNKYKNLTGVYEKREGNRVYNGYGTGCRVGSLLSLYSQPTDNNTVVFVTEGEKKAMVANILLGYPTISVPGVSCFMKLFEKQEDGESMIDALIKKGCKMVVVCYDADKAENINVLNAQDGLAKALKESQIKVAIGEWDSSWGKGLDDTLVMGIKPTIYPVA